MQRLPAQEIKSFLAEVIIILKPLIYMMRLPIHGLQEFLVKPGPGWQQQAQIILLFLPAVISEHFPKLLTFIVYPLIHGQLRSLAKQGPHYMLQQQEIKLYLPEVTVTQEFPKPSIFIM